MSEGHKQGDGNDESRQTLESWLALGMAEWEAYKRSVPSMTLLPPQLATLYSETSPASNATMLNGLALAASLQQSLEAGQQQQTHTRPIPQRPTQYGASLVSGSLPSRLNKRDLADEVETPAARKRSKSEDNLSSMEDQGSPSAPSPHAKGKRLGSSTSRLTAIQEQDLIDPGYKEGDDEETIGLADELDGIQDDREIKRIRRKQSNRESARRSRLRKQRESEALSSSVAGLKQENEQLKEANKSLQAKIDELTEQISQGNLVGKEASPQSTVAQKLSAFQVVQRKTSDGSRSTDSHTHSLSPSFGLMANPNVKQ